MSGTTTILGLDGGATRGRWRLVERDDPAAATERVLDEGKVGPCNVRLASDEDLTHAWASLPPHANLVGLCLAGCATDRDRRRVHELARGVWPNARIFIGSDRDSAFYSSFETEGIVVIAGTGSAIEGRRGELVERAGGRGHLLGDRGSAYQISLDAIQATLELYDLDRIRSSFAERLLRKFSFKDFDEVVTWAQLATKFQIAALADDVMAEAVAGDRALLHVVESGARALAHHTRAVATRLGLARPTVRLTGGMFEHHELYRSQFARALKALDENCDVALATHGGAYGAVRFAMKRAQREEDLDSESPSTAELVDRFVDDVRAVHFALHSHRAAIESCVDFVARQMRAGGRLIYVGAGTSGRLGVLDASEIPPTFGMNEGRVEGVVAGGDLALRSSVEGAEDDEQAVHAELTRRNLGPYDVVCGIAASGTTPFVLSALRWARAHGVATVFLTCNPQRPDSTRGWDREVDLPTGREFIEGSTRLKAGTATKVLLNLLSTSAMIRLGRVQDRFMVDMKVSNHKLRERAVGIVCLQRGCTRAEAERLLTDARWNVRDALAVQRSVTPGEPA